MAYEAKALNTGTNSGAELVNVYDQMVQDTVYNSTTTYSLFKRAGGGGVPHFKARTGRNSQATYYAESDPIVTGQTAKVDVRWYWKLYKAPVEVTGLMIEQAKATGGELADLFNYEMRVAAEDMGNQMNSDVHSTGSEAAAGGALAGLKRLVDDGSNYATLYGVTRTGSDWTSGGYDATSEAISLSRMRTMIRTVEQKGARKSDLAFVTSYKQKDAFLALMDSIQRVVPMETRFGFGQTPIFDGIPIIADKDCPDDYLYLLDLSTYEIRVLLEPTMKNLPSQKDAEAGFIRTYQELICKQPSRSYKKINLT